MAAFPQEMFNRNNKPFLFRWREDDKNGNINSGLLPFKKIISHLLQVVYLKSSKTNS